MIPCHSVTGGRGLRSCLARQGAEAESSQASGLPEQQSEFKIMLGNLVKPCLKTESEEDAEDVVQRLRGLACEALHSIPV